MTTKSPSRRDVAPSWSSAKRQLSDLPPAELVLLVRDLWNLAPDNRQFITARLGGESALLPYVETIEACLYPDILRNQPLRLREGRRAISAYRKATLDKHGTLQLQLRYIECGTAFAVDFGALDETLAGSLTGVFRDAVASACVLPVSERAGIFARLESVVDSAQGLGWGFYDDILDILETARDPRTRRARSGA